MWVIIPIAIYCAIYSDGDYDRDQRMCDAHEWRTDNCQIDCEPVRFPCLVDCGNGRFAAIVGCVNNRL
jgi:hypothetical protein